MLKEALEYIVGLKKRDEVVTVDGATYLTGKLEPPPEFGATPLRVSTLGSVAEFLVENRDSLDLPKFIVHVDGPAKVLVLGPLSARRRQREQVLEAVPVLPEIKLNQFIRRETFQIQLQACFERDDTAGESSDLEELLRVIGNMEAGETRTVADDGVSQEVTVRKHAGTVERQVLRRIVALRPFRTFPEVDQPLVNFVFRVREEDDQIQCALFEADGGKWRAEAASNVAHDIRERLVEVTEVERPAILS